MNSFSYNCRFTFDQICFSLITCKSVNLYVNKFIVITLDLAYPFEVELASRHWKSSVALHYEIPCLQEADVATVLRCHDLRGTPGIV